MAMSRWAVSVIAEGPYHTTRLAMPSAESRLPERRVTERRDLREAQCNTRRHEKLGRRRTATSRTRDRSVHAASGGLEITVRAAARYAESGLRRRLSWQLNQPVSRTGKEIGRCSFTGQRRRMNLNRRRHARKLSSKLEDDRVRKLAQTSIDLGTIVRHLQQSSSSVGALVRTALDDRQLGSIGFNSYKHLSRADLVRQLALVDDCANTLHWQRYQRLIHGGDQTPCDEVLAANLEYLLLQARQALASELAQRLIKSAMRNALEQLDEWTRKGDLGGDQCSAEYASNMPPPSTTWPWSIKPCLAVIWGVCWMFYANSGDMDFYEGRTAAHPQVPCGVFYDDLSGYLPPPEQDAYRRYGQQLLGAKPGDLEDFAVSSSRDDEGVVAVQGPGALPSGLRPRQPRHSRFSVPATPTTQVARQAGVGALPGQQTAGGCSTTAGAFLPGGGQAGYNNTAHAPPTRGSGLQCVAPPLFLPEAVGNVWSETPELFWSASTDDSQHQHFPATSPPFPSANASSHLIGSAHPVVPLITVTPSNAADVVVAAQAPTTAHGRHPDTTYQSTGSHQAFVNRSTADNAYFDGYFDPTSPATHFSQLTTDFSRPATVGEQYQMGFITATPPINYQMEHTRPQAHGEPDPKRRRYSGASDVRRASIASEHPSTSNMSERDRERDEETTSPEAADPQFYARLNRGYTLRREGEPPRNGDGKFVCEVGDRCRHLLFDRKCEWGKHMDKHERPYRCDKPECSKLNGFTYSGGLLRHQREVHKMHGGTGKQQFCPISNCKRSSGSGFTRKENLQEHLRRVHRRTSTTDMSIGSVINPRDEDDDHPKSASTEQERSALGSKRARSNDDEDDEGVSDRDEKIRRLQSELHSKDDQIRQLSDRLQRLEQIVGQTHTNGTAS